MGPQEMGLGCKSYFYESELIQLLFRGIGYFGPRTNQLFSSFLWNHLEESLGIKWSRYDMISHDYN